MIRLLRVGSRGVPFVLLAAMLSALGIATPAQGATVIIDDFAGNIRGTRTINLLPPPFTSTTPQGTFSQSGGFATMTMTGNGNGQGGVELIYNFGATDLTDGGNNKQFFLEFTQLQRTGGNPWDPAISITLRATDSGGTTGYYNLGTSSQSPFNIVLNFTCPPSNPACPKFEPPPNFASITSVAAYMVFPSSHSGTDFTTAVLDVIRATPEGGAPPTPPYPSITPASDPDCALPVRFNVSFGTSVTGFAADDFVLGGTAPGPRSASVSGGPADYTVDVSGPTGPGTVSLQIPADKVLDTWDQGNVASATVAAVFGQAPVITSATTSTFLAGSAGSFTVAATGTPVPTFTHQSGALPAGLSFSSPTLGGTASLGTGGSYPIVFAATNGCGVATQDHSVTVNQAPSVTSASATSFTTGAAGSFTVTVAGFPAPAVGMTGALPSGVVFDPGTRVLSGTPAAGTGGSYPLTFTATNGIGTPAQQSFTLTVNQPPAITSGNATTFTVGAAGTFTVTATGFPAPGLSATGALPSGVSFDVPTGVLSGTPGAGSGGSYPLTVTAANGALPNASQSFTLTVNEAPSITSASSATFTTGAAGSFTVTVAGFPAPTVGMTGALPSGVVFDSGTRALSGTPAAGTGGSYPLTFTATNGIGTPAQQTFTLTVNQPPAITSGNATTFTVGEAGTFTATATGFPAPGLSVTGALPSGVSFDVPTGVLSGTPGAGSGGSYPLTVTAANGALPNASQSFTLTVNEAPSITSANAASFTIATAGSFTVTRTGYPAPTVSMTGALPSGVVFDSATRVLSGTPAAGTGGSYPLTFTATNGIGTPAQQDFTLTVSRAGTTTTVTAASPDPSVVGEPVAVGYTVTAAPPAVGTPSGTVTVSDGVSSCSGTVAAGTCSLALVTPAAGTLTATYAGDTAFLGSTGTRIHTVNRAATTTTITGNTPEPSRLGSSVTVTFDIAVSAPGSGTPTGTVTVTDGVDSCSASVSAGSCTIALGTPGGRALTASYAGDAGFEASATAAGTPHVVIAPPSLAKGFSVPSVPLGLAARLTFTVANHPDNIVPLTLVCFEDIFPAGLEVATPSEVANSCGGSAVAGSGDVSLDLASVPVGGSCQVSVNVIGTSLGVKNNVTSVVRSVNGGDGNSASASLDVTGLAAPQGELSHGFLWTGSLAAGPGPAQEQHLFAVEQIPFASYEVVVDAVSSDVQPIAVDLLADDGWVVGSAQPESGVGASRSLRWITPGTSPLSDQSLRIRSGGCTTGCGPDDLYRLRFYETTLGMARFNNTGSQTTVLIVQNPTNVAVTGVAHFWGGDGVLIASSPLTLTAHGIVVLPTSTIAAGSGGISIAHDAPYGALAAKAVGLDQTTGFTFESALLPRER